jgi:hypothetical protein
MTAFLTVVTILMSGGCKEPEEWDCVTSTYSVNYDLTGLMLYNLVGGYHEDGDDTFIQNVSKPPTRPQSITAQKITTDIFAAMRTSNLSTYYVVRLVILGSVINLGRSFKHNHHQKCFLLP